MALADSALAAARAVDVLSASLASLVGSAGSSVGGGAPSTVKTDRLLAAAMRLGQMPETIDALKRALAAEFARK